MPIGPPKQKPELLAAAVQAQVSADPDLLVQALAHIAPVVSSGRVRSRM
jgi:hypothetical protein